MTYASKDGLRVDTLKQNNIDNNRIVIVFKRAIYYHLILPCHVIFTNNLPIPLGILETITPLIKSISIFSRWRTASQIHGARARLITSNHVVRRMRLMQSTKVDDISNISVHSHLSNSRPPPPSTANLLTSRFGGVARHLASAHRVSATSISSRCPPRSLASHDEMSKSDAALWDEAYAEE